MQRTVICNAIVPSMDPKIREDLDADGLMDGEKIAAILPNIGPVDGHEIARCSPAVQVGLTTEAASAGALRNRLPPPAGSFLIRG
jgi:hypothetical protein